MTFFSGIFTWLDGILATAVQDNLNAVATAIEPAAASIAAIYVLMWAFLSLTGRIPEPFSEGAKRILVMVLILGIGIKLWLWNTIIVDTFYVQPARLATAILAAGGAGPSPSDPRTLLDTILAQGMAVGDHYYAKGGFFSTSGFGYYIAGTAVYLMVALVAVYVGFLLGLSKVALAVILGMGPIFIVLLFFDATKNYFGAWIAQLSNYALISVLATLVAGLLFRILDLETAKAKELAGLDTIVLGQVLRVCIACGFVLLVMRQVMSMASGLASGVALSSFGAVSGLMSWSGNAAKNTGYQFGRGVMDGWRGDPTSRWDPLRRSGGNLVGRKLAQLRGGPGGAIEGSPSVNTVPRERVMPPRRLTG